MVKSFAHYIFRLNSFKTGLLCIIGYCLIWYSFGYDKPLFFSSVDSRITDAMFRIRGSIPTTGSVVIVDLDEQSMRDFGQWPWSRDIVAQLTAKITSAGAKVIGFDILFAEQDRTSPLTLFNEYRNLFTDHCDFSTISSLMNSSSTYNHDQLFSTELSTSPGILGYMFLFKDDSLKNSYETPFPTLNIYLDSSNINLDTINFISAYRSVINTPELSNGISEGFINVFPDSSGTVRKVPLFIEMDNIPYPSLAFEMVRVYRGVSDIQLHVSNISVKNNRPLTGVSMADTFIPTDDYGQLTVNFRGGYSSFPYISATKILKDLNTESLKDKIVLIGSSAAGLMDIVTTPFSSQLPGVEVHANIIDNLLQNDAMVWENYTEISLTYFIIIIAGLLIIIALVYLGPLFGFITGFTIIISVIVGNYHFLFQNQRLFGTSFVIVALLTIFITVTFFNYLLEGRKRMFIKKAFSHYVSPSVIHELISSPEKLNLSIENREVTILFCDIRNFTTLSETTPIAQLGLLLNEYFSIMTDIITQNNGMVDKYIGDAIMAVWGTPLDDKHHCSNAVRAAIEMQARIEKSTDQLKLGNQNIEIGIGINSGYVSAGNFGSNRRFDYTVLGDNVNLASRIEGLTKYYKVKVLISETTREHLSPELSCRFIDRVMVKGQNKVVSIYEPRNQNNEIHFTTGTIEIYQEALEFYRTGYFKKAVVLFERLHEDTGAHLYHLYSERCRNYITQPPEKDWNGKHDHNLP